MLPPFFFFFLPISICVVAVVPLVCYVTSELLNKGWGTQSLYRIASHRLKYLLFEFVLQLMETPGEGATQLTASPYASW